MVGSEHWQAASYQVPAVVAIVFALGILTLIKSSPVNEGLPPLNEIFKDEPDTRIQIKR